MLHLVCPSCGKKLRVKEELAGKHGVCPACQDRIFIPHAREEDNTENIVIPAADEPTASTSTLDLPEEIPLDDLPADASPTPIVFNEPTSFGEKAERSNEPTEVPATSEIPHDQLPVHLSALNHYIICDHKDIVARWSHDGRGWMVKLKDGFARASTVTTSFPAYGSFVLIEVRVAQDDEGMRLDGFRCYQLQEAYALSKLAKSEEAILSTIVSYATLNPRQKEHVRELVRSKFLPHLWTGMDKMLEEPAK